MNWWTRSIDAIVKTAKTGKVGDGKIFVSELQRVIRIRTGETDDSALPSRGDKHCVTSILPTCGSRR